MKDLRLYLLLSLWLLPCVAFSQGYAVDSLFQKYGKRQGSILVELGKDVLQNKTKISYYKSLMMEDVSPFEKEFESLIASDTANGSIITESRKDGKINVGMYVLTKQGERHEYLLYSRKSRAITLLYLKGDFPPEKLQQELQKMKDLIIKIDGKRIKL